MVPFHPALPSKPGPLQGLLFSRPKPEKVSSVHYHRQWEGPRPVSSANCPGEVKLWAPCGLPLGLQGGEARSLMTGFAGM